MVNQFINKVNTKIILEKSIPIENNPNILKWLVNLQTNSYKNKQKNLSQSLLNELSHLFGNCNKSLRLEFITKVWVLKYNNLIFNVFTAKNKGTSIEIIDYKHEEIRTGTKVNEIIEFLEELHKLINELKIL